MSVTEADFIVDVEHSPGRMIGLGDVCGEGDTFSYVAIGHLSRLQAWKRFMKAFRWEAGCRPDTLPEPRHVMARVLDNGGDWFITWDGDDGDLPMTVIEVD